MKDKEGKRERDHREVNLLEGEKKEAHGRKGLKMEGGHLGGKRATKRDKGESYRGEEEGGKKRETGKNTSGKKCLCGDGNRRRGEREGGRGEGLASLFNFSLESRLEQKRKKRRKSGSAQHPVTSHFINLHRGHFSQAQGTLLAGGSLAEERQQGHKH